MSKVLNHIERVKKSKALSKEVHPIEIRWNGIGHPAKLILADGAIGVTCVRCSSPPCLEYTPHELKFDLLKDFPLDQNPTVCPTDAISWPAESQAPVIAEKDCIFCGVCLSRCPARAIYFKENGACIVDHSEKGFVEVTPPSPLSPESLIADSLINIFSSGQMILDQQRIADEMKKRIDQSIEMMGGQFPNILVRNILLSLGLRVAIRRRGDNNLRMDLLFETGKNQLGVCEIEFGSAAIDTPRNILDDISVLVARFGFDVGTIIPLTIHFQLPNQRSEYWRLIKDIKDVLHLEVNTLSVGALFFLIWNWSKIRFDSKSEFYLDSTDQNLQARVEKHIGRLLGSFQNSYYGMLLSEK